MGYETLRAINPRLIYASISGFGQSGPWAQRPGYDLIAQAMSGVLSATGHPGGEPVKNVIPVADLGAGLFAANGILAALIGRQRSGRGDFIDASLLEAALGLSIWETAEFWGTGRSPQPLGSANRMSAPYQAVRARDGHFVFGANNDKLWLAFLGVAGRAELADDARYATNADRVANNLALIEALRKTFLDRTVDDWVGALLEAGVPAAPIYDYAQALASDHVAARDMVLDIAHPVEGSFKALGFPVKLKDAPLKVRFPPPLLGEHSDELRRELADQGLLAPALAGAPK
jgi:crotonobetainyl-CoA:carnitine CoA-transferase CaiB-like acyl-CoA transferase